MLRNEREFWSSGGTRLAGVDEAGRGPLAGPVVAAAVIFDPAYAEAEALRSLEGLTDSKKLSAVQREHFYVVLKAAAGGVSIGVGFADHLEIDRINILNATHVAMARALAALAQPAEHALVDGRPVRGLPCASTALVGGDGKSLSIAAASVIAKVTRDRLMCEEDRRYPAYGFAKHKGYGTSRHMQALLAHGSCAIHRHSFTPVREAEDLQRRRQAERGTGDEG